MKKLDARALEASHLEGEAKEGLEEADFWDGDSPPRVWRKGLLFLS